MSYSRFFKVDACSSDAESDGFEIATNAEKPILHDIYLIDFDGTISSDHTHNGILKQVVAGVFIQQDEDAIFSYIQDHPQYHPIGGSHDWKLIIEAMIKNNRHVAIISFNSFPAMIAKYLSNIIGLSSESMSKIYINAWLPEKPASATKEDHIIQVINHFQYQGDATGILLVDDSLRNIEQASQSGYDVMHANQFGGHVQELKFELQIENLQENMHALNMKGSR